MSISQNPMSSDKPSASPIRGIAVQAVALMAVWLIMSGHYDFEHIFYGALSVALVIWLNHHTRRIPLLTGESTVARSANLLKLAVYLVWLAYQIIKSGVYVAYLILQPKMRLNPMVVSFESNLPTPLAHVILGNSITLTPGTLTVDLHGDRFTVHALTPTIEADLISGEMEARVARLYGDVRSPDQMCTDIQVLDDPREIQRRMRRKGGDPK
jgi:multicomponent Na+:H+ antiporter subunit E